MTTGLSRKGIYNARNALKQHGIIDFKSNGQKATSYKLVSLLNNTQPTTQDIRCLQDITQDTTQGTTQLTTQGTTQDSATLNKLKETKLKEIKSNVPASAEDATPELKEECRYQEDSTEYKAAIYLREQILNFNPKCKVPADTVKALQQWADTIRLMFERDKRTKEELHKMVKYIFQSPQGEFWRPNVQSPAGLRRNWDTIYGQMIQKDNSKNKSSAKKTAFNNLEGREWDFDKLQKLENERRERLNKELDVIMGGA
ncbi:MAG: hypothetical protein GX366_05165 [Epulopiscium sp.]|nr:hypothetical protein [Candidatus Epulonipiscium sp.]